MLSNPVPYRRFLGYAERDFCYSCNYFKQIKGHYGTCIEPNVTKSEVYDGSKKGTGCSLWRIRSDLWGLERKLRQPEPVIHRLKYHRRFSKKFIHRLILPSPHCPKCKSINTRRSGRVKNSRDISQKYVCYDCKTYFSKPNILRMRGMRSAWLTVDYAKRLRKHGLSVREIGGIVGVSGATICYWMQKYAKDQTPTKWKAKNLQTDIYSLNQVAVEGVLFSEGLAATDRLPKFLSNILQLLPSTKWFDADEPHSQLVQIPQQFYSNRIHQRRIVQPHRPIPSCCNQTFPTRTALTEHKYEVHAF